MLLNPTITKPQTIGFHYVDRFNVSIRLEGIGWEKAESASYRWNGLSRGQEGAAIFQYTLSGRGELRIGEKIHSLPKHHAFMCKVPGDHEYYLPEGETHWEYFFVTIHGEDALRHWSALEGKIGPVFELPPKSAPLGILSELYADIVQAPLADQYDIAASLYRFILEMHRYADASSLVRTGDIPEPLLHAISLIRQRYREDLSLDELAKASGLTKYHFCRLFQKKLGIKPMQYINKVRIERAVWLLRYTDLKIAQVGEACGFTHASYFIKTFRGIIGSTPGDYRSLPKHPDFDQLKVEI
ncbi:helix-turn-helix domain-containing protein [Cohnella silvisoli]|uniref:AraC family transcriptional regulator n=1 Tax=Cohnella silvisoli TaxID=2873699 RepID=A0ABV1KRJ1_9BACL|nr:AraC family transcriptional regulator [Cohnella silvisoli]MCD9021683.1 AraC family transcriptional regulator [Cohnella silvisoli]